MFTSLSINNFRCFRAFTMDNLQRVNLIAGTNDVGKTAVLEALYLLVGETNGLLLLNLSAFRGLIKLQGETRDIADWLWKPLFHRFATEEAIQIKGRGGDGSDRQLQLRVVPRASVAISTKDGPAAIGGTANGIATQALALEYRTSRRKPQTAHLLVDEKGIRVEPPPPTPAMPGYFLAARTTPPLEEDARNFGELEKEKEPYDLLPPLQIIEPRLTRLRTIPSPGGTILYGDVGLPQMVPLGLLGDGLGRFTSLLVKIATARHGVVLIDEIENGFHYTILKQVWAALAEAAASFDVQVFATAHSWECIRAAHAAFAERKKYDFRLHRLERAGDQVKVATYSKRALSTSLEMNLEVR
jgi:hypothetical protein